MLDTVQLILDSYRIPDRACINVSKGEGKAIENNKHLFTDRAGPVTGMKAYINSTLPTGGTWALDIKSLGPHCLSMVHFSVPKAHCGNNFFSVGREGARAVIDTIERDMAQKGIEGVELLSARIARVDLAHNVELEHSFAHYAHLLQALTRSTLALDNDTQAYAYQTGTRRRLTVVYDKIAEMAQKGYDLADFPPNVMRLETRVQKAQTVRAALGLGTVRELLGQEGYNMANGYMLRTIHNKVLNYEPGAMKQLMVESLKAQAEQFKEAGGQVWGNFTKALGIKALLAEGGLEVALDLARAVSDNDRVYRRRRSEIQKVATDFQVQVKDLETLYREIKTKVPETGT